MVPHPSSQQSPRVTSFFYGLPSRCEGGGLVLGWGQGRESSHSADTGHSEAGFVAFGPGGEKGGNVRNILTQQSPPTPRPSPQLERRWGRTDC